MTEGQPAHCPFDIDDLSIAEDPYRKYAELRAQCPVGFTETRGGYWYLTDYESVRTAFNTPDVFSSAQVKVPYIPEDDPEIPLQLDGELHAKWRKILDPLFSKSRVATFLPLVQQQAEDLLDAAVQAGSGDFATAFTIPFPSRIFCIVMGLPADSLDQYLNLERDLANVAATRRADLDDRAAALKAYNRARAAIRTIFADLKQDRLKNGMRDDVVSALLTGELDGQPISDEDYHNVCVLLFIAGLETVTATLGNIFWYLAEHQDQWQALRADPSLVGVAVEEFLRYESVVAPGRVVVSDTELHGATLHAGDRVLLFTGSAGRDETVFEDPDEVVYSRKNKRHLAFGSGPHRCLGTHLARQELRVALEAAIPRISEFHLTPGHQVIRKMGQTKSFDVLPLTITGADRHRRSA